MYVRRFLAARGVPGFIPIYVYQMAKVGSSAVYEALLERGLPAFHFHRMNREHLERMRARRAELGWAPRPLADGDVLGLKLYDKLVSRGHRAKIITLVRDPIARNLSSYFEHLDAIWNTRDAHASVSMEDLHRGFGERFPHDEALTWFDDELRAAFGIDVYKHPFPASGHQRIGDLLILKTELDDATKAAAVAGFLGLRELSLKSVNVTEAKAKGDAYRRFRSTLRLDPAYVDRMLDARYTRHFYTDVEREAMRRKYVG